MTRISSSHIEKFIEEARVARLATIDSQLKPHLVPAIFVFDGSQFFIPIDGKKKRTTSPAQLKRIRNIQQNPTVALLIDRYTEEWSELAFVMIQGIASIANKTDGRTEIMNAYQMLRRKYAQYQSVGIGETCIIIRPENVISWKNSNVE